MKAFFFLAIFAILTISSCTTKQKQSNEPVLGDTIQTESGLQYIFLKKGKGRKIETGCEIGTYLSLKVKDSVVWNTNELPDSLFTFVANYSRLIKGFTEVTMLLREGDEIIAILPDSLAYGAKGAGDVIPPHATLIYDQFRVIKVGEPKAFLSDTLLSVLNSKGIDECCSTYKEIISGADSIKYHTKSEQLLRVHYELSKKEEHQLAADFAYQMAEMTKDSYLMFKAALSNESLGKLENAKVILEKLLIEDPENKQVESKLKELVEKE